MTRDLNIHFTSEINVHMSISFTIYMPFDWSCDWSSLFLGSVYVVHYMDWAYESKYSTTLCWPNLEDYIDL